VLPTKTCSKKLLIIASQNLTFFGGLSPGEPR